MNRVGIYHAMPYVLAGVALWACVYTGDLHATLAGIILAAFIPTRPPPDFKTLALQADAILTSEALHHGEQVRSGPSGPAMEALDAIHDRLESPADRMLRNGAPLSSYFVLPVFPLANAGVTIGFESFNGRELLMLSIVAGLTIGKPLGFALASALAVGLRLAEKAQGLHVASTHGCWGTGRCGLHDVALHCRTGVSGRRGFRRRQDCSCRGVHAVGPARHGRAVARIRGKVDLTTFRVSCPNGSVWTRRWRRLIDSASTSCHPTPRLS